MPNGTKPEPIQPVVFNGHGYLPAGFHALSLSSIHFHLVEHANPSETRKPIFEGYQELRACFETLGLEVEQWLDGSFTTTTPDPGDLDLANFFDPDQIDTLSEGHNKLLDAYTSGKITRALCRCDSYFALKPPENHPLRHAFETAYSYWIDKFGTDRNDIPKGIVTTQISPTPPTHENAREHADHATSAA